MFGMGWAEMMIVGVVALIVVGPKDLPIMFRKLGNAVGKAKGMAREFSRAMNDAADGAGMKDTMNSINSMKDTFNDAKSPTKAFTNYVPGSETEKLAQAKAKREQDRKDVNALAGVPDPSDGASKPAAKPKAESKPKAAAKPKAAPKAKATPKAKAKPKAAAKKETKAT